MSFLSGDEMAQTSMSSLDTLQQQASHLRLPLPPPQAWPRPGTQRRSSGQTGWLSGTAEAGGAPGG